MVGGTAARIVLNAVPFVLPLMFQLRMGYDAVKSGLMLTPLFIGNIGVKPLTTPILRAFGFRPVIIGGAAAIVCGRLLFEPEQALAPFRFAFVVLSLLMLGAFVDHRRLAHDAGASVSASRRS